MKWLIINSNSFGRKFFSQRKRNRPRSDARGRATGALHGQRQALAGGEVVLVERAGGAGYSAAGSPAMKASVMLRAMSSGCWIGGDFMK